MTTLAASAEWVSPKAAAVRLGLTPETVRALMGSGRLAHRWTSLGREVDAADLERLIRARAARAGASA
jgi:hypothetical protein